MPEQTKCISCGSDRINLILSLGDVPLADVLLKEDQLNLMQPVYPLELYFCFDCSLVQGNSNIPVDSLYGDDYAYHTSVLPGLLKHFRSSAEDIIKLKGLGPGSLVIEAASNDGCMLQRFHEEGIDVLGIDPAVAPATIANNAGIHTLVEFFNLEIARKIYYQGGRADVVVGNNVLNLVTDLHGFVEGMEMLMKSDGLVVLELPYVGDLISKCAFDNIYHQNTSYFSLLSLESLLKVHNLYVNSIKLLPDIFGGSVRYFIGKKKSPQQSVKKLRNQELRQGINKVEFYQDFEKKAMMLKQSLRKIVSEIKNNGKRIVAYGAGGGMATTLLNFVAIDGSVIDYAVDINKHKHGRYTTGHKLKIYPPSRLVEDKPDYVLLLAWNYAGEIIEQNKPYRQLGGKFIIPIPEPTIV